MAGILISTLFHEVFYIAKRNAYSGSMPTYASEMPYALGYDENIPEIILIL